MAIVHRLGGLVIAVVCSMLALGCCHGEMKSFNISASLHDSLRGPNNVLPSVEVDVIAVNNADLPAWEQKSVTEYFSPGDTLRASADKYVFKLGDDKPSEVFSTDSDAGKQLWKKWKDQGAINFLILSSFPSPQPDLPGDQDPRRRTLPLGCDRWDSGQKVISFQVKSSGLTVLTPPNPLKQ